jgi:hypothetical protein
VSADSETEDTLAMHSRGLPLAWKEGQNGILLCPACKEQGARMYIPENGEKPVEVLHYPPNLEMKKIEGLLSFQFATEFAFRDFFELGLQRAFVIRSSSDRPQPRIIVLENVDGERIQIASRPHEIENRHTLSVLHFNNGFEETEICEPFSLDACFLGSNKIVKLVHDDDGLCIESGIEIISSSGNKITIIVGNMPFSLAIKGMSEGPYEFLPELIFENYKRVSWEDGTI